MGIVEHVDMYPTFAELAGAPVNTSEESIGGTSYASLFDSRAGSFAGDAAYTQYPRCCQGKAPYDFTQNQRCAYVDKTNFTYMGYSVRTTEFRYTEFAEWDGQKLKPIWNSSVPSFGSELYDHKGNPGIGETAFDDFENENLAFKDEYQEVVAKLSKQLRDFYDGHGNAGQLVV